MPRPLRLPPPVLADPPQPFPLVGAVAPVLVSVVLWLATGHVLALVLAAAGPLVAVASTVDGRLTARRRRRRSSSARAEAVAALELELDARLIAARLALDERHPAPGAPVAAPGPQRVRAGSGIVVGRGPVPSGVAVEGDPVDDADRALVARAARLEDAPVVVDAARGVAVAGPRPLAEGLARAVRVQLRRAGLRHPVTVHATAAEAPADCPTVVVVDGAGHAVVHAAGQPVDGIHCVPLLLDAPAADALLRTLRAPDDPGSADGPAAPPDDCAYEDLPAFDAAAAGTGLPAVFARDARGGALVDLVVDGPHAIVGGTTGSGKTELLLAWALALAERHPPDRLALLLTDFKGGAGFDALAGLPHCVGVLTDLDAAQAERGLGSLAAEVRRRERLLRERGAKDIAAAPDTFARLVVVVDEYRALVESSTQLAALFADLAARGRSLGVHLVLCTQRPSGAVRDAVLANAGLRIALRSRDAADSRTLVGDDSACMLPAVPGRAVVVSADGDRRVVQAARLRPADLAARVALLTTRYAGHVAERPWLPPLPARIPLESLLPGPGGVVLGLVDRPDEQAQPVVTWDPVRDGGLLVLGGRGSGRTRALHVIAAQRPDARLLPEDPEAAWDVLADPPALLLADRPDLLLRRLGHEHRQAAVDALEALAAEGRLALACGGESVLRPVLRHLATTVLLRADDRDDHVARGGSASSWDPRLPPGGGHLRGERLQLADAGAGSASAAPPEVPWLDLRAEAAIVVVTDAAGRAAALERAGIPVHELQPEPPPVWCPGAHLLDPQTVHARWQALQRARTVLPVAFLDAAPADVRLIAGRAVLPPVVRGRDRVVLLAPDGALTRRRLVGLPP